MSVVIHALVAACTSKACAPPPVGTGGSDNGAGAIKRAIKQSVKLKRAHLDAYKGHMKDTMQLMEAAKVLDDYIVDGYQSINRGLRNPVGQTYLSKHDEDVRGMDNAFKFFSVHTGPGVLHRGMDISGVFPDRPYAPWDQIDKAVRSKFAVGSEFTDPAFVSTSTDPTRAERFTGKMSTPSIVMRIHIPEGTRILGGHFREDEAILNRGSRFRVISVNADPDNDDRARWNIDLELVQ